MQEWLCHICRLSPSLAGGGGAVPVYLCWVWQSVSQSVPAASLHSYLLSSPQLRSTSRTQSLLNIPSHHTTLTIIFSYLFLSTHVFYSFLQILSLFLQRMSHHLEKVEVEHVCKQHWVFSVAKATLEIALSVCSLVCNTFSSINFNHQMTLIINRL